MNITYFHWSKNNGPGIGRSFRPLIEKIKETESIREYYVPYSGSLPWNLFRNILFVFKHRDKKGINHITGDIHYCVLGLIGCKSVLTIHDDYAVVKAHRGIFDKIYKWIFWLYLPVKFSKKVVCISEATRSKIDKLVKNRKTEVITHHTVDRKFVYVPKEFNASCPTILQVGTDPQKNLETTMKAVAGLDCKLRVVKKMTAGQHLLAHALRIDYSNVFNLSDDGIVEEFVNADIVVFPSLYEGFGIPIIEGQATGRVVITSAIPPMNEVAGQGAVLLNDPLDKEEYRDAILKVIKNHSWRNDLIIRGLKNVKRYTVEKAAEAYLNLYRQMDKSL